MNDIQKIYQIIFDETYKNPTLLDIELSKIQDTKLIVGMLCDLYAKEDYKANKATMILSMRNYDIENLDLKECNAHYLNQMKEHRKNMVKSPSVDKLTEFISILSQSKNDVIDGEVKLPKNPDYVNFVKNLNQDEFNFFKNILLQQELYEEIVNMEKIYKTN